jgi:hypothetical protein
MQAKSYKYGLIQKRLAQLPHQAEQNSLKNINLDSSRKRFCANSQKARQIPRISKASPHHRNHTICSVLPQGMMPQ